MSVVVGLDVGTSGVKGLAVSQEGEVLARAEHGYRPATPRAGWSEQNPGDWWLASRAVLESLRASAGPPSAVGLAGQMHGLVALDARDRPIRPAILWNDQRTAAETVEIEQLLGVERLLELTGNRAQTGLTAPKLLWLRRHEPDAYARIDAVLLPKDYVRLRLTAERATDVSDASGTLLFDVGARSWSEELCAALDIDPSWLPPALESPQQTGATREGVPVAAGAGDQAAGALGVGVLEGGGPASVVLGSSGVAFRALDGYAAATSAGAHTFCHAAPERWHAMGVMLSAAASLRWLRDVTAPDTPYEQLLAEAERWEPGTEGLMFLPYLAGERTPHMDPGARGSFAGLSLRHDRGALVRAVLEGVAQALRDCLEALPDAAAISSARASGGGTRSELWLRIVASVLGMPLERTAVDEGAAFGAALLGGVAAGIWSDPAQAVAATVRSRRQIDPDPEWTERYAEQRSRFRALYPAIRKAEQ